MYPLLLIVRTKLTNNTMEKRVILNREVASNKFGVVLPSNKELKCYVDSNKLFVQHPEFESVYIRVEKSAVKESNFNLD